MSLGTYGKTVTALVTGLIGWATLIVNSPSVDITASEWIVGATALATALGGLRGVEQRPVRLIANIVLLALIAAIVVVFYMAARRSR